MDNVSAAGTRLDALRAEMEQVSARVEAQAALRDWLGHIREDKPDPYRGQGAGPFAKHDPTLDLTAVKIHSGRMAQDPCREPWGVLLLSGKLGHSYGHKCRRPGKLGHNPINQQPGGHTMALRFIAKDPNSPENDSPTIYDNGESYVLQGFKVTDAAMLAEVGDIPAHESLIVFPKRMMPFFPEVAGDNTGDAVS